MVLPEQGMKNGGNRYQIFLVLVKSQPLSDDWEGGGTRWLVTQPILTEGGVLSPVKMGKCGISVKLLRIILIGLYAGFSKIVPTLALNLERHVVLV